MLIFARFIKHVGTKFFGIKDLHVNIQYLSIMYTKYQNVPENKNKLIEWKAGR